MDVLKTAPHEVVCSSDIPDEHTNRLMRIVKDQSLLSDIRFFRITTTEISVPTSPSEAVECMEQAGISVNPGIEDLLFEANFFPKMRGVPDMIYFALMTPRMFGHTEPISTYHFLRYLAAYNMHCDGLQTVLFRTHYLAQHRHVEMFFQVATWPLKDTFILCISNTYKGNFLSAKNITISTKVKPDSKWLVVLK